MKNTKKVLVVGPSGNFGGAVFRALVERPEFSVRVMLRPGREALRVPGVESVFGDATKEQDLMRASAGMDVVIYGFHAGYVGWRETLIPAARTMAQVAMARSLRVVYPGNVYGLGDDYSKPLSESAARHAPTDKGRIRNEIEALFEQSTHGGARLLIVRAGDYFGPHSKDTWFEFLTKDAAQGGALSSPEMSPVDHAWAYLPDVGATVAALLAREDELGPSETFHFGGHVLTPMHMMEAVTGLIGPRNIKSVPWFALRLAGLFSPFLRELLPMRYLWQQPVRLDDSKLRAFLGTVPHTPLREALTAALGVEPAVRTAA